MHWFDRASQQLAESPRSATRRTVLQGATFAALAAPFGKTAVTYAANQLRRMDSEAECLTCLIKQSGNYNQAVAECEKSGKSIGVSHLLKPKGGGKPKSPNAPGKGGKKKKGVKPTKAAEQASCITNAYWNFLYHGINACRIVQCAGIPAETAPPQPDPQTQKCPAGTMPCAEGLCCYGGDKCCSCGGSATVAGPQGGSICCAAVIGCECCGAA
jgi:hypothetical protein